MAIRLSFENLTNLGTIFYKSKLEQYQTSNLLHYLLLFEIIKLSSNTMEIKRSILNE